MPRLRHVASAVGLAVFAGMSAAVPSGAAVVAAPAGSVGHDVSYPQCARPLPAGGAFGIVGVNGGRPFTANPCLAAEQTWANTLANPAGVYLNTSNPGPASTHYWPAHGASDPAVCQDETSTTDPGCAYDYGWHAAADALTTATAAGVPLAGRTWWLDVETTNSWVGDDSANAADLAGALDFLRSHSVSAVGLYSTDLQWTAITGGYTAAAAAIYKLSWAPEFRPLFPMEQAPLWAAGVGTALDAANACAASFTGSPTVLAQFADNGFDADLTCSPTGATPPPVLRKPAAPSKVTARTDRRRGIDLTWTAPAAEPGAPVRSYQILRSQSRTVKAVHATVTCASTHCTWTDSGAHRGRVYHYRIDAINKIGAGTLSKTVQAKAR